MPKKINSKEFEKIHKQITLQCKCGWHGTPAMKDLNLNEVVMDFECPNCDQMLLIVDLYNNSKPYVLDQDKKKEKPTNFMFAFSGDLIDDKAKLIKDIKDQFPKEYKDRLLLFLTETRELKEELSNKRNLSRSDQQELTNLKYDIDVFIEALKVVFNNPKITEEMLFPVQGGPSSD